MSLTSSIYDHFIIWSSSVTLAFNLPNFKIFYTKNPNIKKEKKVVWGEGGLSGVSGGGGRGRWMDRQTRPSQLAPWGHNNALMYKLCPWQAGGGLGWVSGGGGEG